MEVHYPSSSVASTKTFSALVNGLISPCIREAYAPYTYEAQLEILNQLKGKLETVKDKLATLDRQANGIAILNNDAVRWKQEAEDTLEKMEENIKHLESNMEATCTSGCLPNCCRRRAARKSIRGEVEKVDKLLERYRPVVKGFRWPHNDSVQTMRGDDIEKIWECISQRNEVKVVCIHGIAGVGKTAVAEAVCNKALLDNHEIFGYVIWVEADYGIQLKSLQEKIMRRLNIELADTDDDKDRATKIRDEFVRRKKCLVIIDFLWENFTLRDIGIPEEETEAEGVVCKVILTSRSLLMCRTISKDAYFEIKPLCESWECFNRNLGSTLSSIESEAKDLVKKAVEGCDGLPLAIIMLAYHMREMHGQSSSEIASSLKEILRSQTKFSSSVSTQFKRLEYSYKKLESSTHQQCFLYCALYPKGFSIEVEQLIDNWIWEGLLDNHIGSLEDKRKQGRNVLVALKRARLLEKAGSVGTREAVKMLSLLHDMAMNIIFEQRLGFFINSGNELTDFPPIDDQNGEIQRVSFMHNKLGVLKLQPNCPQLSTLLLQKNPLDMFSDNFFTGIPNLKLLDLSYTNVFNLPSSACNLRFLQVLRLRHCLKLRSLPRLSNLEELIVLDLFGTPLEELPLGMERLKKLKRLDLSHTKLTTFQAGLVSALESLQELLFMMNDAEAYSWRSKQTRSNSREAYAEELSFLDSLRVLQINFFNKEVFNEYMKAISCTTSRSRPRFKFCVGGFNTDGNLGENSIAFIDGYPVDHQLPEGTLELYLSACRGSSLSTNNTLQKTGIDFQKLKVLNLFDCSSLTYLFSFEMMHCLQSLEKIHVRNCWSLSEIIKPSASSSDPQTVFSCCLLKLQELILIDLPMLERICPEQQTLKWPEFRRFSVWNCDKLARLPLVVSQIGEHQKIIKLRAKSSRLADSHHIKHEEADRPEDTVSFVSTKNPESTLQSMPNDDQASYYKRKAAEKSRLAANNMSENDHENEYPPQSPGFIVRRLTSASDLVKKLQRRIGVMFI